MLRGAWGGRGVQRRAEGVSGEPEVGEGRRTEPVKMSREETGK